MRNSSPIFFGKISLFKIQSSGRIKTQTDFSKFWANQKAQKKFEHFKRKTLPSFKEKLFSSLSNFYEHLKRTKKIQKEQTRNTKISFDFSSEYLF